MKLALKNKVATAEIVLPRSKSISNRLIIMEALEGKPICREIHSKAKDSQILMDLLASDSDVLDCGMAGTVFRFLTAFYARSKRTVTLTGANRMKKRPIAPLVTALRSLGAKIDYLEKEGFPPLRIEGRQLIGKEVTIDASISSQFLTALALIAPYLEKGLTLKWKEQLISAPYFKMTLALMKRAGADFDSKQQSIKIFPKRYQTIPEKVEADWSSAAFFYQVMALSKIQEIILKGLSLNSIQGDNYCATLFKMLGVESNENPEGVMLRKVAITQSIFEVDLIDQPDLILPFAVTAALLLKQTTIHGIKTLRAKESDRVAALKSELGKIGVKVSDFKNHMILERTHMNKEKMNFNFHTFNDHRMAMSFAPLVFNFSEVDIQNPNVVEKSFPDYWKQLEKCGVSRMA